MGLVDGDRSIAAVYCVDVLIFVPSAKGAQFVGDEHLYVVFIKGSAKDVRYTWSSPRGSMGRYCVSCSVRDL